MTDPVRFDAARLGEDFAPHLPTNTSAPVDREKGYALIAAVAAIAVFGALALAIATATRISIAGSQGEMARARADAAADAGVAIVLQGLIAGDATMLVLVGGRSRHIDFAGAHLTIHVTDERGKVSLNHIEDDTVTLLLEQTGLSGADLAIARDSLLDWLDFDDLPHANGAETEYYAQAGIAPRNGMLASVDELARIRGFTPALVAQLRPYVTVDNDALPFDPSHAQPQALAVMSRAGGNWPEVIERQREMAGQQPALDTSQPKALVGHPLAIAIDADIGGEGGGGGHAHHEVVAVVTGSSVQPYIIHSTT